MTTVPIPGTGLCFTTVHDEPEVKEWLEKVAARVAAEIPPLDPASLAFGAVLWPLPPCLGCGGLGRVCDHPCPACQS
jgi:hypothetical protein